MIDYIPTIITFFFLLIILSYYFLIFVKSKKPEKEKIFSSITVIIPARNEEKYIGKCIESVLEADFDGEKEVIVIDDGSRDKTSEIVKKFPVRLIRQKHSGKSASINKALPMAKGELVAIVDADSIIHKDSLKEVVKEVERKNVAAASCVIRVKNRRKFICMWVHIEQIYNSLVRHILSKVNANIVTPGPLSVYRKKELLDAGGFSTKGFSEDIDITIRLIRRGHRIGFARNALSETNMPYKPKEFLRQRTRFARGLINILKTHLRINKTIIDIYTIPIFLFSYIQAIIMGSFIIYQIFSGYIKYFISNGILFNFYVVRFFFEWFSIVGFVKWMIGAFIGQVPLNFVNIIGILSTLLSYPLFFYAIVRYDKKFDWWHIIPLFFMFPFWLLIMFIYILCIPEYFIEHQYNIWKKNE